MDKAEQGFVYCVRIGNFHEIGTTQDPTPILTKIRTENSPSMELVLLAKVWGYRERKEDITNVFTLEGKRYQDGYFKLGIRDLLWMGAILGHGLRWEV